MRAPGLLFVTADGCDLAPFNCAQASQEVIDEYHRSPSPDDVALAKIVSAEMKRLKEAPPPGGISGSNAFGRIQELMVNFAGVKARPLANSWFPYIGVLHDFSGHIQLRVQTLEDQATLLRELSQPGWLSDPKGLFLRHERLQPVKANLTGILHPAIINAKAAKNLEKATLPLILTSGPPDKEVSLESQRSFMETSAYLAGWVHAARIQNAAPAQLRAPGFSKLNFRGFNSAELKVEKLSERFDMVFGNPKHLSTKQHRHLLKSYTHLWSFAYWFSRAFVAATNNKESGLSRQLATDFRTGVEQLIKQHLRLLSYFRISEGHLSPLGTKILLYLRQAEGGASGRQICRKFSVSADVRDGVLEELTNKHFAFKCEGIFLATPIGEFSKHRFCSS